MDVGSSSDSHIKTISAEVNERKPDEDDQIGISLNHTQHPKTLLSMEWSGLV